MRGRIISDSAIVVTIHSLLSSLPVYIMLYLWQNIFYVINVLILSAETLCIIAANQGSHDCMDTGGKQGYVSANCCHITYQAASHCGPIHAV